MQRKTAYCFSFLAVSLMASLLILPQALAEGSKYSDLNEDEINRKIRKLSQENQVLRKELGLSIASPEGGSAANLNAEGTRSNGVGETTEDGPENDLQAKSKKPEERDLQAELRTLNGLTIGVANSRDEQAGSASNRNALQSIRERDRDITRRQFLDSGGVIGVDGLSNF